MCMSRDKIIAMGDRLRHTRIALNMTQAELGKILGIQPNSLSSWESGIRMINPLALAKLWETSRVTADWIYLGDPSGLPYNLAQVMLGELSSRLEGSNPEIDRRIVNQHKV